MPDKPLTARQERVMAAIRAFTARTGDAPTLRELATEAGYATPSAVDYHLQALEAAGHVTRGQTVRVRRRARSIRVT